ncbi:MAG: 3-isopropylmalate dehydratase large subunit [Candidatus Latescibacteria bacterium]|jgi:3-isopropylmalate/(R)-2-methylmalate dehydratase large subunit|nr:3-isopropylmalate dehydratase large subunit [Candidatus Latescibacterota bacterium]
MGKSLFHKVWDTHKVRTLPSGQAQLFIGLHLIHEVTSPQAFQMLRERNLQIAYPERTFATVDHIVPTNGVARPFADDMAERMMRAIEENAREFGVSLFSLDDERQGIVHVIGPELGLTQPGMTIACGDSHTSTHGAFGAIAFGIGTSQVRDVLATQCLAMDPLKVRRIEVSGQLGKGVYAKDVILNIIRNLGVKGGVGYAYEYAGEAIESMDMEARMSVCNMSIEGGARAGYISPDQTTFDYLAGRAHIPSGEAFERAVSWWESMTSDEDANYDDVYELDGSALEPTVTWGITPSQALYVTEKIPALSDLPDDERDVASEAYDYMDLRPGTAISGTPIDVAFVGSCTNSRITDLREAAHIAKGNRVAKGVKALVVPGSKSILKAAEAEGLHHIFEEAGFEWRGAGCSMCLAMNPDKLQGREVCASSSNRNFKGRQGSPTGRTLLMSPAMVAAAAIAGEVIDVRTMSN